MHLSWIGLVSPATVGLRKLRKLRKSRPLEVFDFAFRLTRDMRGQDTIYNNIDSRITLELVEMEEAETILKAPA